MLVIEVPVNGLLYSLFEVVTGRLRHIFCGQLMVVCSKIFDCFQLCGAVFAVDPQ